MKQKILTTFICLLATFCAKAQTGRHFDANKNLSSSYTTQLYIDRDGFLWVATRNGLNRYDGYQTLVFKKEKGNDMGMASNYVNCILHLKQGVSVIAVTHYMDEAVKADKIIVLSKGEIALSGTPKEVFAKKEELNGLGLELPLAGIIADKLRAKGVDIPDGVIDEEGLLGALWK